jgi:serine/threonine protein kinase
MFLSVFVKAKSFQHFVFSNETFLCMYKPAYQTWNVDRNVKVPRNENKKGIYLYTRMELADKGDLDKLIHEQPNNLFPPAVAKGLLFQLAMALYELQEPVMLIYHYDLKPLNMFICKCNQVVDKGILYYCDGQLFKLTMPNDFPYVLKLGDFGSSTVKQIANTRPVTSKQFTTLVNTPPEYFILGNKAMQGPSHDMFGFGLAMIQLFAGFAYYDIMRSVKCPENLKICLEEIWSDKGYSRLCNIIDCLEEDGPTLYYAFYCFIVLFGIPDEGKDDSEFWNAIKKVLDMENQYHHDHDEYSIHTGKNKYIQQVNNTLGTIDGGMALLKKLCNFNPSDRGLAKDILFSEFMECFIDH